MKYLEKTENKFKILDKLLNTILKNKVRYREWKIIHDMFISIILTERIEKEKIKLYAITLITSHVECYYIDEQYLLKNEINKLKTLISLLSIKEYPINNNYNYMEMLRKLYMPEKNIESNKIK